VNNEENALQRRIADGDPTPRIGEIGRFDRARIGQGSNGLLERNPVDSQVQRSFSIVPFEITEDEILGRRDRSKDHPVGGRQRRARTLRMAARANAALY
jgi:hypothetical protein